MKKIKITYIYMLGDDKGIGKHVEDAKKKAT
jgi:hypothetical protein